MVDTNNYDDVDESLLIDDSYTVSYAFDTEHCIAYHDYIGNYRFATRDLQVFSFNNNRIYLHNSGQYGQYYTSVINPTYITPVYKPENRDKERLYAFILESLNFKCDFYNDEVDLRQRLLNKTFSTISIHNSYQSTSEIPLTQIIEGCSIKTGWGTYNIRAVRNVWYFNKIKDETDIREIITLTEKFDEELSNVIRVNCARTKRMFVDDFVIVKLLYDNIDQLSMQFSEINFKDTIILR